MSIIVLTENAHTLAHTYGPGTIGNNTRVGTWFGGGSKKATGGVLGVGGRVYKEGLQGYKINISINILYMR